MTGRERIKAALTGAPVDRPPVLLGDSFILYERELPDDEFFWYWMREKRFLDLREYVRPWCDCYCGFAPPLFNRYMMVSANRVATERKQISNDLRIVYGTISLPSGDVHFEDHQKRGFVTDWYVKVPGNEVEALERIIAAPFEVDEKALRESVRLYDELDAKLGDNGYINIFLPSPAVTISNVMHLELFLELCHTEPELMHGFCEEVTRRMTLCIDALFREKKPDCAVMFGGCEQFTPPLMRPESFDEFVVPYEGKLVKQLKKYGNPLECHCHGKISYAIHKIMEMGYDAINPIEPPPQGDLTYAEARAIADDKITLVGNIEVVELELGTPEHMKRRIQELLSLGKDRLMIVDAGAGLRQALTERMDLNYRAWIDEYAAQCG